MRFTDRGIQALKPKSARYIAWKDNGNGLGIRVSPKGRKTFVFMYRFDERPRMLTLGTYGTGPGMLSLADAHAEHAKAMQLLENGIDPGTVTTQQREAARRAPTVADLADEYLEKWARPRKRSWREDERILRKDVVPAWGRRKARDITRRDVIALLDEVVARGSPVQANRTLACVRKMFNFGVEKDLIPGSPCVGVKAPSGESRRDRVLSEDEIRALWFGLDGAPIAEGTALALKLQLVTAQRKGEVVGATWDEFDIPGRWWTIPGERSKNKLAHRVPLTRRAVSLLERMKELAGASRWLVPSPFTDRHIRPESVNKALHASLGAIGLENITPHDLRRTAATEMAKTGVPRLVIKKLLNHAETDVTAVYDRASYDREKRQALETWSRRLDAILAGTHATVTSITDAAHRRAAP